MGIRVPTNLAGTDPRCPACSGPDSDCRWASSTTHPASWTKRQGSCNVPIRSLQFSAPEKWINSLADLDRAIFTPLDDVNEAGNLVVFLEIARLVPIRSLQFSAPEKWINSLADLDRAIFTPLDDVNQLRVRASATLGLVPVGSGGSIRPATAAAVTRNHWRLRDYGLIVGEPTQLRVRASATLGLVPVGSGGSIRPATAAAVTRNHRACKVCSAAGRLSSVP